MHARILLAFLITRVHLLARGQAVIHQDIQVLILSAPFQEVSH